MHFSMLQAMSTSPQAVMLCSWGVKTGMVRVWLAGKLCDPIANTDHI